MYHVLFFFVYFLYTKKAALLYALFCVPGLFKIMKRLFFAFCLIFFRYVLCCEPSLEAYLANDLELKRLALEVQKTQLASKKTVISSGFNVRLSTGRTVFRFTDGGTDVSFEPSVTVSVPQAQNLSFTVSTERESENGIIRTQNTSLSLSADIISGNALKRKAELLAAERSILEAKRALQNRALQAETEFYSELKALFSTAGELLSARQELYEDEIALAEVRAKGYAASSAKYRMAEMDVLSDRYTVETKERMLEHDCAVFASKCGAVFEPGTDPFAFLPSEIPPVQTADIASFPAELYAKTEQAEWEHSINSMLRKADREFTLSANGGYTFKNSYTGSDSADIGLSSSWRGLSLGTGISFPVNSAPADPAYTVSAAFNPAEFRFASIERKTNALNDGQELLAIRAAQESYDTSVVEQETSLSGIRWDRERNRNAYGLYRTLEEDMRMSFEAGIVSQAEYLSARSNRELYRIRLLINDIELIICSNTTKLLFCRDEEIQD